VPNATAAGHRLSPAAARQQRQVLLEIWADEAKQMSKVIKGFETDSAAMVSIVASLQQLME
jgi:hypothetical protein